MTSKGLPEDPEQKSAAEEANMPANASEKETPPEIQPELPVSAETMRDAPQQAEVGEPGKKNMPSATETAISAEEAPQPVAVTGPDAKSLEPRAVASPPAPDGVAEPEQQQTLGPDNSREVNALFEAMGGIRERLDEIRDLIDKRTLSLGKGVEGNTARLQLIPEKLRLMGSDIEGLTTSVSESRFRSLLLSVLNIYDIVDQIIRARQTAPQPAGGSDAAPFTIIHTQLRQMLTLNGLHEITAEGKFDPGLHKAVQRTPCGEPALDNTIRSVIRPGFRTSQNSILRFAEVDVWSCAAIEATPGGQSEKASPQGKTGGKVEADTPAEKQPNNDAEQEGAVANAAQASATYHEPDNPRGKNAMLGEEASGQAVNPPNEEENHEMRN